MRQLAKLGMNSTLLCIIYCLNIRSTVLWPKRGGLRIPYVPARSRVAYMQAACRMRSLAMGSIRKCWAAIWKVGVPCIINKHLPINIHFQSMTREHRWLKHESGLSSEFFFQINISPETSVRGLTVKKKDIYYSFWQ